jgi:hypothetical protein
MTDLPGPIAALGPAGEPLPGLDEVLARLRLLPEGDQVQAVRSDQAARWRAGQRISVESYLERLPGLADAAEDVQVLLCGEAMLRRERGESADPAEYQRRFPSLADRLPLVLGLLGALAESGPDGPPTVVGAGQPGPAGPLPAVPGYELLDELGRGGMGVVYRARQVALDRVVALKMVLAGGHAGQEELARFRAEAEAVARLQHPNVVQIHEVGEAGGLPYLCLEFCEGGSLADRLDGTPWPAGRAAGLVEVLARALDAAHQRGVVHRDLKPANVLVSADGVLRITDFGLVKWLDPAGAGGEGYRTRTGAVVGTPAYMSPEQAAGGREVGPATDIYALGAVLYELLVGRPPFEGDGVLEVLRRVVAETLVPPRRLRSSVPRDLETICLKCLEKDPQKRYPSAAALAEDLHCYLTGQPIRARPVGPVERLWWACRRNPVVAGLTAALGLFLVVAAVSGTVAAFRYASLAKQARLSQTDAEERAEESRRRLVQQYVVRGEHMAELGDFCSALACLAEALHLDQGDPSANGPTASPCAPSSGRCRGCSTSGSSPTWPTPAGRPAPTAGVSWR